MTKINNDIEDISRQYSNKLFNHKINNRISEDELSIRKTTKSFDKLQQFPK